MNSLTRLPAKRLATNLPEAAGARLFRFCWIATCVALSGCAHFGGVSGDHAPVQRTSADARVRGCATSFAAHDAAIDAAGVRDGSEVRVPGFPFLRSNRFLASFRDEVGANAALRDAWLTAMRTLDRDARSAEAANLRGTGAMAAPPAADCSASLAADATKNADIINAIARNAGVRDDYSLSKRALGLYPLTQIVFFRGVSAWQTEAAKPFAALPSADAAFTRYEPAPRAATGVDASPLSAIQNSSQIVFRGAPRDALGLPQMTPREWNNLFNAHAPIIEVESTSSAAAPFDRIGALAWSGGPVPAVDTAKPTVYRRVSHTRIDGRTHTQLNYSFWFSERPRSGSLDLLGGALDGVIWRVTLDHDGQPLIYDSIHACGCYHLFFPTPRLAARPAPSSLLEWAFVPTSAPVPREAERMVLRLASGTHYLTHVSTSAATAGAPSIPYQGAEDETLRSLPNGAGYRSIFDGEGLVRGTERGERWLFWPMGIASAGAMRQWGRHATAFVGRRHFDDADLFDLRFTRRTAQPTLLQK
jgi:hypothetical protein